MLHQRDTEKDMRAGRVRRQGMTGGEKFRHVEREGCILKCCLKPRLQLEGKAPTFFNSKTCL